MVLQLASLEPYVGHWQDAIGYAEEGIEPAEQTQEPQYRGMIGREKAWAEAQLGLVERARSSAEEALASSQSASDEYFSVLNRAVLGHLELALGNLDAADHHLRGRPGRLRAAGQRGIFGANPWPDAIETLIERGELELARTELDHFAEIARSANRLAQLGAARCAGLLAAASGHTTDALASLKRALVELDQVPYPLDRGRALLALGIVQRQAKQPSAARASLEAALATFDEHGAKLWMDRVQAARETLEWTGGNREVQWP